MEQHNNNSKEGGDSNCAAVYQKKKENVESVYKTHEYIQSKQTAFTSYFGPAEIQSRRPRLIRHLQPERSCTFIKYLILSRDIVGV